jgi:ABC-type transport system involved in cytochrome c biogenesis permease component
MQSLKIISAIFVKDMRVEWRNREALASMCVFGILVVFLFNFAFEPGRE